MHFKNTIVIISILLAFSINAQNSKIDQLKNKIAQSNDTTKVLLMIELVNLQVQNDPHQAEITAQNAIELALKINFKKGATQGYIRKAGTQNSIGKYDDAVVNLLKAIDIYAKEKDKKGLIEAYNLLGNTHLGLKNFDKALVDFQQSYKFAKLTPKDIPRIAIAATGISTALLEKQKFRESLGYLFEAEKIFKDLNAPVYYNYTRAMIGNCHFKMGKLALAKKNIESVLPFFLSINDEYAIGLNNYNLGCIYEEENNPAKAAQCFEIALALALKRNAWDNIQENTLKLSNLYDKLNNTNKAFENYKLYTQYKDSISNKDRNTAIANAETKFETEKKEQKIQLQGAQLETSRLKISKRNNLILIFSFIVILFSGLFVLLIRQIKQTKKANKLLFQKNEIINFQKDALQLKNQEITDSINYAKRIQEGILPNIADFNSCFSDSFVFFQPKDIVSGDFYWKYETNEYLYFALADCTGHGVPGGFMTILANSILEQTLRGKPQILPHEILDETRNQIIKSLKQNNALEYNNDGMDIIVGCYEKQKSMLHYAAANNAILLIRNGELQKLAGDKQPCGYYEDASPFLQRTHNVTNGDVYYFSTDGFPDQFGGPNEKKFKSKTMSALFLEHHQKPMKEQEQEIKNAFYYWKGDYEQTDDVLVIGVRF